MKKTVIIYHKNCTDGFGSAFVAWKIFGDGAHYIPVSDRENTPTELIELDNKKDVTIYILDFCYKKDRIKELEESFKRVVILDHHISSEEDVKSASEFVYGTDKSGIYLAWEYFFPQESIPKLVEYISDGDTWTHKLNNYSEVLAYIYNQDHDFQSYDKLQYKIEHETEEVVTIGRELLKSHKNKVEVFVKKAEKVSFEGYIVYAVNAGYDVKSEVGHILAERTGNFSIIFYYEEGLYKCSLRSVKDFDVSKIAEKYGGGGHKNAAAFVVKSDFPVPFIKSLNG